MVLHPASGWTRCGNAYASRKAARNWVPFVSATWKGLRTRVAAYTLRWDAPGRMSERSRRVLDRKFNASRVARLVKNPGQSGRRLARQDVNAFKMSDGTRCESILLSRVGHGYDLLDGSEVPHFWQRLLQSIESARTLGSARNKQTAAT